MRTLTTTQLIAPALLVFVAACCGPSTSASVSDATSVAAPAPPCRIDSAGRGRIDLWIERNGLNLYGDPQGTLYIGGTPLFDEASGKLWDRYELVLARHPELTDGLCPYLSIRDRMWIEIQRSGHGLDPVGRRANDATSSSAELEPSPLVTASGGLIDRAAFLVLAHEAWYVPGVRRRFEALRDAVGEQLAVHRAVCGVGEVAVPEVR